MSPPVFRFAPSPNGYLHLGHALSAILNFEAARASGGRFLLRIEDIDATRCRPEYEAALYEDLAWLGLTWERPVRRQSQHFDFYKKAIDRLTADALVYPAFESRGDLARLVALRERSGPWPRDPDGAPLYAGDARLLDVAEREQRIRSGAPFALRLDLAAALDRLGVTRETPLVWQERGHGPQGESGAIVARPQEWGDIVLGRKETPTSYHLSVVVDDAAQGVTHVVRGEDLFWATSVHRVLQELLGLPAPIYRHHRLIRDVDGRKLAKSTRATALRELRAAGLTPTEVRVMIGMVDS